MKKGSVITLSIITLLLVLTGILFGTVFCLRSQSVVIAGELSTDITKEEIVKIAGLKNGKSIFMLDKDKAINNIEKEFPDIKVIQIKTVSLTKIEIKVRARHEMFYTKAGYNYYLLDEDLKVLHIVEGTSVTPAVEPTNLTHILDGSLNINSATKVCDFVGTKSQQEIINKLYNATINTFKKEDDSYFDREAFKETILDVGFENEKTFNKIIISTKYGVKLDIENPSVDLVNKMNICYHQINYYLNSEDPSLQEKATKGRIKIYYDLNNEQVSTYIAEETKSEE